MKRRIVYALLAALIAFGLWYYVVTVVNPEWEDIFYNIPVVLENEEILTERGLMLVSEEEPKVTLRLSGNRTDMILLNSSNITLRADLSKIYSAGEQTLGYSIVYPGDFGNNAFRIISQTPQMITLSITEWKSKDVDVQVEFSGAVPEQYIAFKDKATLDYEKITVTGPADVIDTISVAKIVVNLDGQMETISQQYAYTLCDAEGNPVENKWIKTNVEQVQYTLKIQQWKDIELRLDVVDGGGLKRTDCVISATLNTLRVSGSEKMLEDLEYLLLDTIDLGKEIADVHKSYEIVLPEGITNLSGQNTVSVTVDIPDLEIRPFTTINPISAVNTAGMQVVFSTTELIIQVRGTTEGLNALKPADLLVQVDFAGAAAGTASYEPIVTVTNPQLANVVGVVGNYEVIATVTVAP
jgi:YbbR domain-containing protein